jgi:hypothetical protein
MHCLLYNSFSVKFKVHVHLWKMLVAMSGLQNISPKIFPFSDQFSQTDVLVDGSSVMGLADSRGSWVVGRMSWVVGRMSWVKSRGSWVKSCGSWVKSRGSWVKSRGSRIKSCGSREKSRGSRIRSRGSWENAVGSKQNISIYLPFSLWNACFFSSEAFTNIHSLRRALRY